MLIHINYKYLDMSILFRTFVVEKETNKPSNKQTPKTRKGTSSMNEYENMSDETRKAWKQWSDDFLEVQEELNPRKYRELTNGEN